MEKCEEQRHAHLQRAQEEYDREVGKAKEEAKGKAEGHDLERTLLRIENKHHRKVARIEQTYDDRRTRLLDVKQPKRGKGGDESAPDDKEEGKHGEGEDEEEDGKGRGKGKGGGGKGKQGRPWPGTGATTRTGRRRCANLARVAQRDAPLRSSAGPADPRGARHTHSAALNGIPTVQIPVRSVSVRLTYGTAA